jgi:hypothetical protein
LVDDASVAPIAFCPLPERFLPIVIEIAATNSVRSFPARLHRILGRSEVVNIVFFNTLGSKFVGDLDAIVEAARPSSHHIHADFKGGKFLHAKRTGDSFSAVHERLSDPQKTAVRKNRATSAVIETL